MIAGHTRENRLFLVMCGRQGAITDERAARAMAAFGPGQDAAGYRAAFPDASSEQLFVLVHTDWLFRMPTLRLVEAHTAGGGRAYMYELAWPAPHTRRWAPATASKPRWCSGLSQPTRSPVLRPAPFRRDPRDGQRLRTAWTGFVATGEPGWPAYDLERRRTRIFDAAATVAGYPKMPPACCGRTPPTRRSSCRRVHETAE